ncbi:hypothetical protein VTK73DRAFT_8497 [Phialemonium thermophilum]|uniref:Uncharacterized protein n=1 Tax=Phialemonium thermophilum TaxID=223376 RepID=A0ABR3XPP4_9PEZI
MTDDSTVQDNLPLEDSAAVAAAMGFSSFGTQHPSKKRRFNARADAVVAPPTQQQQQQQQPLSSSLPPKPPAPAMWEPIAEDPTRQDAGGSAHQPRFSEAGGGAILPIRNTDEIRLDLDDDDDGSGGGGRDGGGMNLEGANSRDVDPGSQYGATPVGSGYSTQGRQFGTISAQVYGDQSWVTGRGRGGGGSTSGRGGRQGTGARIWWTDYYDPSSNENPWESLEIAKGLKPVGSWLPRGPGRSR